MDDRGFLANDLPPRQWSIGSESPVIEPLDALPAPLAARLKECAARRPDALPPDYGDAGGLWVTVRARNPFDILLLDPGSPSSAETLLVRFRVLWKFWTQKSTIARQGATRTVIRQKYGENLESYIENLQWAYDQLSSAEGLAFWRKRVQEQRAAMLWSRVAEIIDATLADGLLDLAETQHLMARAEQAGYVREEFAGALRGVLHARRFESERAPLGSSEAERLASVRWATAEVWARIRASTPRPRLYYLLVRQATLGPMTAVQVEDLIRRSGVSPGDGICLAGATGWQPIGRSIFAHHFHAPLAVCPRCGGSMSVASKSVAGGVTVLILGVFTLMFIVGVILIVVGIAMIVDARKSRWRCTRCGLWS